MTCTPQSLSHLFGLLHAFRSTEKVLTFVCGNAMNFFIELQLSVENISETANDEIRRLTLFSEEYSQHCIVQFPFFINPMSSDANVGHLMAGEKSAVGGDTDRLNLLQFIPQLAHQAQVVRGQQSSQCPPAGQRKVQLVFEESPQYVTLTQ